MMDRAVGRPGGALHRRGNGAAFLIALAIGVVVAGSSAQAQLLNPFARYKGPALTREDLNAGSAAALKLLDSDPANVGQAESWTGPKSGDTGTFTIRRVFERSGMPCREMTSAVTYKRPQRTREFTLTACRTAKGQWKLAS